MKKISQKEELRIYRDLLITLHTCRWTGNNEKVVKILDKIGYYSYARTNSFEGPDYEQRRIERKTLLALKDPLDILKE